MVQRKTCLQDAAEPAMKAALQRSSPGEKDSIFAPQAPSEPVYPQGAPSAPASPEKQGCEAKSGAERDACLKSEAISALDISKCGRISGASLRKECISDVARKTKDIGSCAVFNTTDDVNFCKLYAKGEEAKS
jgi:hypothetical protein